MYTYAYHVYMYTCMYITCYAVYIYIYIYITQSLKDKGLVNAESCQTQTIL